MKVTRVARKNVRQYDDVRLWGLYQDGVLVTLAEDFATVQSRMLESHGDCRQVTIVADKEVFCTVTHAGEAK